MLLADGKCRASMANYWRAPCGAISRIAIVFVTGYVGELLQEVRDNSPYDEVLPKPFQLNELVEVVNWPPPINE